jgi:3-deoxy-D-manno-octulosonic-acid transferase
LLYTFSIFLYQLLIKLVSTFNPKAKLWVEGRKNWRNRLQQQVLEQIGNAPVLWFHCASLGEFEQGRNVIEQLKTQLPTHKIVLTFFSPSGYEVRKNYQNADLIFYLPADTRANAQDFVSMIKPQMAFFVKYEFWYYYLRELNQRQILTYSIAAIFRPDQVFFRWYGGFFRQSLQYFTHLFLQNEQSATLLQQIGINNWQIAGDTRFDRVKQIADACRVFPLVEAFKGKHQLLVVGSCWQEDFDVLLPFFNDLPKNMKVIIAPHEIKDTEIEQWQQAISCESIRYSTANIDLIKTANILMIDNIGMLSSLYQYAEYAWIGGGYGKGLHNILEAATFGLPIFFGNLRYQKFQEANDLVALGGAYTISSRHEFVKIFEGLHSDELMRLMKGNVSKKYVSDKVGATDIICKVVMLSSI